MAPLHASETAVNGRDDSRNRLPGKALILAACALACSFSVPAQVSVTTWHNDIGRTGQNLNETILNLSDVNTTQFGKLFSQPVDGYVYAQPLYLPNVTIGGQSHNVVFVATENDSVYAFDANNNGGSNASPLWFDSMLSPTFGAAAGATTVPSGDVGTDISPQVGITGTPVIDPSTGTLYVVSATLEGSTFVQRLHALDVTSGAEKFGAPIVINASVPGTGNGSVNGTLPFDPEWENQRAGLLLLNGIVYIGYASHGDNGPWHGWILGYNAHTLQQTGAFCATHNGVGGGMWMGGAGLAAEVNDPTGHPYGRMFVATGNGDYTASAPYTANMDFGDSILNLDLTNGAPNIQDEFTPYNQAILDANDSDVASGGVMLVPTQTSGSFPNLLVQTGKSGTQYLLDRDKLGGYNASGDVVVQNLPYSVGENGAWSTPAYWNGTVYYWGVSDTLKAFPIVNGLLTGPTAVSSETYGYPGANPSISANGATQGIIWTIESDLYETQGQAVLEAHSASNPATTLYSSNTNLTRDNPGPAVKFAVPTIANGLVYVGAESQLSVFGLLNGQQVAAAPVVTPSSESFNGNTANLTVTMTNATPGAIIYYTTDGSTPTTNSTAYTVPISLSASATIQALASAPGYLQSAVTTETYVNTSQVATPVFTPGGGTYTQPVLVTIGEATSGATIYYTTDGSTPTTSSTVYTAPLTIGASETLNAIAVLGGFANSQTASANYVLNIGQTGINFTSGFAGTTSTVIANGSTDLDDSRLQLTNGESGEAGSAWYYQQVNIQAFTTEFSFQLSNPEADGMTFAIQSQSLNALGEPGGGLGYQTIPSSIAVKFDLFSNDGEGPDSTGLYLNGASPTVPAIDLSSTGIDLHSGDTMDVVLDYNGTLLSMTITDIVTEATYSTSWVVNIPAIVGGNTAWVGFTGGTGGDTASQKILTWTYTVGSNTAPTLTPPTFTPASGSYSTAQSVAISDAVTGASIYYTTDGSTPTTTSNLYTAPMTVAASETLSAIAVETGYTSSAIATAAYSISPALPSPTFSPVAGTYTAAQTVTITGSAGTTVYYTTNGTTPTTSSTLYTGPITVSSSESVQAIAVQPGFITSPTASAAYVIAPSGTVYIDIPAGGFSASSIDFNFGAAITGGFLQLTDGGSGENRSAWFSTEVPVTSFITDFYFQQLNANADGMTFTIQSEGPTALGGSGGGLGYQGIPNSVAVKFDLFSNAGEGPDSTGLYTDGASPTLPATDMTSSGVNLHSGDAMWAHIVYNGTNLTLTLTDTVTKAVFTEAFPINIPATVGGNTAYVGFTGGTGGSTAIQNVLAWDFVSPATQSVATPTFSPVASSYTSAQTVTITDTTSNATIYYTTNGTTPTTTSPVYSVPITVSSTETLNAIAVATGLTTSPVATAAYSIGQTLTTPTFSPIAGSYTSAQSVAITGPAGATVYYTTNGTAPTTTSAVYSAPIAVSASETLEAIAVETGFTNSATATAVYTISTTLATPTFSPAAGTYTSAQSVAITGPAGATIHYTTNGTAPTTTSAVYSAPIAVSASETLEAIAVETSFTNSAAAVAAYTITPMLATPTFSPAAGTYTSAQSVTVSGPAGATIHYTTNGTTPTTASPVYSGPVSVSASETLEAIAVETGFNNSAVASGTYTISTGSTTYISIAADGFTSSSMALNGGATVTSGGLLQITDGGSGEARAGWFNAQVPIGTFVTDFTFQMLSATADGMTFAIQGSGSKAVGGDGGGLGYQYLTPSVAVKFDLFSNSTEGPDSTGVYTDGASPTVPATDMTSSGVNLHSGDVMHAHIVYDGTNLTLTLTDTVTNAVFTQAFPVNIPSTIGSSSAYVGFTGGTGGSTAIQNVLSWSYISPAVPAAAPPTFSPAAGPYTTAQSISIADATTGSTIYYTTNGTTPNTTSSVYSTPITVSATETLEAIAVATGYTNSTVSTATYAIGATLPAPTFSVAAGPYAAPQPVSITDSIAGTTIYYTTNGVTPTTASAVYTTPITVSATETLEAIAVEAGYLNSPATSAAYTIGATLPAPAFSVTAGPYTTAQNVAITDATAGTTIYYTTNGITPTAASAVYSTPITVSATETLEAIAVETGYFNSPATSAAYTIGATLPAPTFSVAGGAYTSTQTVGITDTTAGTTIYYTTNGNTPTTASAVYGSPVSVSTSETLEAIAVETGYLNSPATSATYTIGATLPPPTFSPAAGPYAAAQTVAITEAVSGTTVYYTTNGTTPTSGSPVYGGPISVSATETLEAIAVETGYTTSAPSSAAYTIGATVPAPSFSLAAGSYTTTQTVTIGDTMTGTTIYYTTNGVAPTTSSAVYSGPITVGTTETLQAIAVATGYINSPVTSAAYTITLPAPTPTFSVAPGSYGSAQTVAIIDSNTSATIYYTTNGIAPTTASAVYSGPIAVSASETLSAIATATGYTTSAVASAAYTITGLTQAATPAFSVAAGTYNAAQTVTITDSTPGVTIYYTVNGTAPTTKSTVYTTPVSVASSETIEAIAVETGYTTSAVGSTIYTLVAATPTIDNPTGTYGSPLTVILSTATPTATIYYTTNAKTPTSSSTTYTGAFTISSSETVKAIAIETGFTSSAVATAVYTIQSSVPAPTFSLASGTYLSTQTVSVSDSNTAATIYYTTNGVAPTTSSTVYNGPVIVSASETLEAIAVETGFLNSNTAVASYTISPASSAYINYPTAGFTSASLALNAGATVTSGGLLQLTDGGQAEDRSAWFAKPVPVQSFTTDFNFQQLNASGDGMTFAIQGEGPTAVGGDGGGLGYQYIPTSVAVKFDLFSNSGEGPDSTGIYTDGASPTVPANNLTGTGINLHSGDIMWAHLVYDGTNLTLTITDTVNGYSATEVYPINIPATVGGNTAYVGFTGGTGGSSATQNILAWTYVVP